MFGNKAVVGKGHTLPGGGGGGDPLGRALLRWIDWNSPQLLQDPTIRSFWQKDISLPISIRRSSRLLRSGLANDERPRP